MTDVAPPAAAPGGPNPHGDPLGPGVPVAAGDWYEPLVAMPRRDRTAATGPDTVALGGGHGLAVSLAALRRITDRVTAVVTVADDGGSSGRLRRDLDILPPGDLRMALAALCGDDEWGRLWARVLQHRFARGELAGHALGNLLIAALWELLAEPVAGLDLVAELLGAQGRVLPMALSPLTMHATVHDPAAEHQRRHVVGQALVAKESAPVLHVWLDPPDPKPCPEAVEAILRADLVTIGPGSWFTSVAPHLLQPEIGAALAETNARIVVVTNLAPDAETRGYSVANMLEVIAAYAPRLRIDGVVVDPDSVHSPADLALTRAGVAGRVLVTPVARGRGSRYHDPGRLADAYRILLADTPRGTLSQWH